MNCASALLISPHKSEVTLPSRRTSNYLIYDQVSRQPRSQAIANIKTVSMVNSQGTWSSATSRHTNKIENPTLVQQEQIKNRKHADFYAPIGFDFFAFVVSCFGSYGPTAVRCLFSFHCSRIVPTRFPPCSSGSSSNAGSFCSVTISSYFLQADFSSYWACCCQGFRYATSWSSAAAISSSC